MASVPVKQKTLSLLEKCVHKLIKNMEVWLTIRESTVQNLREIAGVLDEVKQNVFVVKRLSYGASLFGSVVAATGALLATFTFGIASPLLIGGIATAFVGGMAAGGADIAGTAMENEKINKAQKSINEENEMTATIAEVRRDLDDLLVSVEMCGGYSQGGPFLQSILVGNGVLKKPLVERILAPDTSSGLAMHDKVGGIIVSTLEEIFSTKFGKIQLVSGATIVTPQPVLQKLAELDVSEFTMPKRQLSVIEEALFKLAFVYEKQHREVQQMLQIFTTPHSCPDNIIPPNASAVPPADASVQTDRMDTPGLG